MHRAEEFDVLILGGGPAGTAAALTLLKSDGLSVAVIEKTDYQGFRVGETLSPGARDLLHYLDVWRPFVDQGHRPAFGSCAAWGSDELRSRDFIYTVEGQGWALDRGRFDRLLAQEVVRRGGILWTETTVKRCQQKASGWTLTLRDPAGSLRRVRARFVVDASGKAAWFCRQQGAKPRVFDRLVGIAGVAEPSTMADAHSFTRIEARSDGWWYSIGLPGSQAAAVYMTDADQVRAAGLQDKERWLEELNTTTHVKAHLMGCRFLKPLHVQAAYSACLEPMFGDRWIAVGEAATSFDPLSSSGIPHALSSGAWAGYAIHGYLSADGSGGESFLEAYASAMQQRFDAYLRDRGHYYRQEGRWSQSTFWRRRQAKVTLDPMATIECRSAEHRTVQRRETREIHLKAADYKRLRELCRTPRPAHQVIDAFKKTETRAIPDQQIILGLQDLVDQGVVHLKPRAAA